MNHFVSTVDEFIFNSTKMAQSIHSKSLFLRSIDHESFHLFSSTPIVLNKGLEATATEGVKIGPYWRISEDPATHALLFQQKTDGGEFVTAFAINAVV